jgi:transposase-like protein
MPGGRPTLYKPKILPKIRNMAQGGATDKEVADSIGIAVGTLYEWKNRYPEFGEALKVGKEVADCRIENQLFKQASEGNTVAMIFWLKNRQPKEWRDRQEHTGADGGPIQIVSTIPRPPKELPE